MLEWYFVSKARHATPILLHDNSLLLQPKPRPTPDTRRHTGRVMVNESNRCLSSDGFEFCCDNVEKLRVTFAIDCGDREALGCQHR